MPFDVERLIDPGGFQDDADHRPAARPEHRNQMVIPAQRQRRLRGKVSRDGVRQLDEVADLVDVFPELVADGEVNVGVVRGERLRQHLGGFGLPVAVTRFEVAFPLLDFVV
ncbi:hypothetical protein [Mycolicibacterium canariasense]|uniref:hypothetical protein n=1 Tax=Mycolicibacterium canariasense TaxID=228230 RepID=UPI0032D59F40